MDLQIDAGAVRRLSAAAELNRRLYLNCLDAVSDEAAARRPNELVNSLGFIACHLLDARHYLARFLGLVLSNPLDDILADVQSIADVRELPRLASLRHEWSRVSVEVHACLSGLSAADLANPSPQRFPIPDATFGGAIEFQLHHESYHIGQLALLRKFYGYPAMTYR